MKTVVFVLDYETEEETYNAIARIVENARCISFEIKREENKSE